MKLQATQPEQESESDAASRQDASFAARFTYKSGSKPLSGYTIKRGIGWGGFGEVYYAVSDGGKEVALKLIRRNFEIELRGVAHCLNLKHPNLLGLHDVRTGDHDDRWVVMEFITGDSLEDVIAAHPNGLPPDEVNAWMHGLAAGVAYLHECGIVHRDLKPGNIFSDQGLVKIGDYGLSKFISCSRRSGQTESVGTVHYMAPEIANGRYGKEIDIYALGVMLYEMLTGRVPFDGESVGEVLMKHLTAQPDLSVLADPYRSIVRRCLTKDPALRYQSVAELIADLPLSSSESASVHRQPKVAPAPRPENVSAAEHSVDAGRADQPVLAEIVPPVAAQAYTRVPEEPIWRWIRTTCADIGYAWNNNLNTFAKIAIIILGLWVVVTMGGIIVPAVMLSGFIYLVYRAVWTLATWQPARKSSRPANRTATPIRGQRAVPPMRPARPPHQRRNWHAANSISALPPKTLRQQSTELTGSLVLSALVCLVVSLVMLLLRGDMPQPEQFVWLALTSIAGTWGILIPAKSWEGKQGEAALRRFSMLVVGLIVGAAAFGLQQALWVDLKPEFTVEPVFATKAVQERMHSDILGDSVVAHSMMTYLSYFGFLFLLVRWWRLANPLRTTRVSLWATALCVTCAGALYMFWPFPASWSYFPQPWGFMLAAIIAIAVQLASPWMSPRQRQALSTA